MVYNIFSIIIIVLLSLLSLYIILKVIVNSILGQRNKVVTFFRSFKKGGYAFIYIVSIPLFFMGYKYGGESVLNSFFFSLKEIVNLIVLKYDTKAINALIEANAIYKFAVYFNFVLVFVNAMLFVTSLINQYLWNAIKNAMFRLGLKNRCIVFGFNQQNIDICLSDKKYQKLLVANFKDKETQELYVKKVPYKSVIEYKDAIKNLLNMAKISKKQVVWIINTGSDDENIKLCKNLINYLNLCEDSYKENLYLHFKAFVFGDPKFMDLYEDIMADSYGCILYNDKYQKIAMDFIDKYPFAKFMDEKYIDYQTTLIKENVDINAFLIGFGKTNQQVFLTSIANNQFLTNGENGEPTLKEVNYFVFDKEKNKNNKNLNHSYFRYEREKEFFNTKDYLPLPENPANVNLLELDINSKDFYSKIKTECSKNKLSKNFIIIAFGSDLENIDMAQKLCEKKNEWGLDITIFAKARNYALAQEESGEIIEWGFGKENYYLFGNSKQVVCNLQNIVNDKIYKMSQMRNVIYDLEYEVSKNNGQPLEQSKIYQIVKNATEVWHKQKNMLERDSSLFACLSIKSKLNLMGLDYVKKSFEQDNENALSYEEFLSIYDNGNEIVKTNLQIDGKPVLLYDLNFPATKRGILARHEHARWNSYMISRGFIPSTKTEILTNIVNDKFTNGRDYQVRKHGNLTTFEGLVEFRQMVAKRDGKPEISKDVIKYDYQLLDDCFWLLNNCGYKIIRKK